MRGANEEPGDSYYGARPPGGLGQSRNPVKRDQTASGGWRRVRCVPQTRSTAWEYRAVRLEVARGANEVPGASYYGAR